MRRLLILLAARGRLRRRGRARVRDERVPRAAGLRSRRRARGCSRRRAGRSSSSRARSASSSAASTRSSRAAASTSGSSAASAARSIRASRPRSEAVFLGRLVRGRDPAASFRPHIGCVPASGGGQRTPTAYHAFTPGKPSVRHVTQITVRPGGDAALRRPLRAQRAARGGDARDRLLRRRRRRPARSHGSVHVTQRVRRGPRQADDPRRPRDRRQPRRRPTRPRVRAQMTLRPPTPAPDAARRSRGARGLPAASTRRRMRVRRALHERRRARVGRRDGPAVAALAHGRRVPARARHAVRRRLAAARAPAGRERQRNGRPRARRLRLDAGAGRQADPARRGAEGAAHVPRRRCRARLKVGLVLFAGEAQVATPPTTDHALVGQAIDDADYFHGFGGTAIGDAIATAVQVGLRSAGLHGSSVTRTAVAAELAAYVTAAKPRAASTLVSILFLSDGHQTRGILSPLAGRRQGARGRHPRLHRRARDDREHDDARLPRRVQRRRRRRPGRRLRVRPARPRPGSEDAERDRRPHGRQVLPRALGGRGRRTRTRRSARSSAASPARSRSPTVPRRRGALLLVLAGVLSALWSPRLP